MDHTFVPPFPPKVTITTMPKRATIIQGQLKEPVVTSHNPNTDLVQWDVFSYHLPAVHHTSEPSSINNQVLVKTYLSINNCQGTWTSKVDILDHRYAIPILLRRAIHELEQFSVYFTIPFDITKRIFQIIGTKLLLKTYGKRLDMSGTGDANQK